MRDPEIRRHWGPTGASPTTSLTSWDARPTSRPSALPSMPVPTRWKISGQPGIGKTALLATSRTAPTAMRPRESCSPPGAGNQRGRPPARFRVRVRESDIVFAPTAAQLAEYLAEPRALVVLDDVRVAREELERILDGAGQCLLVTAATDRLLWTLGLGPTAALESWNASWGAAA